MAAAAAGGAAPKEDEASLSPAQASWCSGDGRSKRSERLMRTLSTATLSESMESWKLQVQSQLRAEREVTDMQLDALRQDVAARALAEDVLLGVERSRDDILAQLRQTFAADSDKLGKQLERVTASLSERIDELNQRIDGLIDFRLGSLLEDDDRDAADSLDVTLKEPEPPQPQQAPPPGGGDPAAAAAVATAATAAAAKAGAAAAVAASARLAERIDSVESRLADMGGALDGVRHPRREQDTPAAAPAPAPAAPAGPEGSEALAEAVQLKRRLHILEEAVSQGSASSKEQLASGLARVEDLLAQQAQAARAGAERLEGCVAELDAALKMERVASEERLTLLGSSLRSEVSSTRQLAVAASATAEATAAKVDASARRLAAPNAATSEADVAAAASAAAAGFGAAAPVLMAPLPQAELASSAPAPPLEVQQVAAPPAAQRSPAAGRAPPEEERPAPSEDPGGGPRPRRGGELAELSAVLASDQGFVSALSTSLKGELRDWLDDQFETHWARWQEEGRLAVPVSGVLAEKAADWPLAQRTSLLDRGGRAGAREDGLAGVEAYVAKKVAEERAGVSEAGVPAPGGAASWPAARAPRQAAAGQGPTPPGSAPDPLAAQAVASTRTAPEGSSAPSPSEQGAPWTREPPATGPGAEGGDRAYAALEVGVPDAAGGSTASSSAPSAAGTDDAPLQLLARRVKALEALAALHGAATAKPTPEERSSDLAGYQGGGVLLAQLMEIGGELRGLRLRLGYLERCVPPDIQRALRYFEPTEPRPSSPGEQPTGDSTLLTQPLVEYPGQAKGNESEALHEVANLSKALRSLQRDKDAQASRLQDLQAAQGALRSRVEATLHRLCSALEGLVAAGAAAQEGDPGARQSMLGAIRESLLDAGAAAAPAGASREEVRNAVQAALEELRGELLGLGNSLGEAIDCKADAGQVRALAARLEAMSTRRCLPEQGSKEQSGGVPFPELAGGGFGKELVQPRNVWSPAHAQRRSPQTGRRRTSNPGQLAPVKLAASHGALPGR